MSYTIFPLRGCVARNADAKIVAPCQSDQDPDFLAYQEWVAAGNQPTEDLTPEA